MRLRWQIRKVRRKPEKVIQYLRKRLACQQPAAEVCSTACYVDDTKIKLILSFTVAESHAAEENLQRIRDWCSSSAVNR